MAKGIVFQEQAVDPLSGVQVGLSAGDSAGANQAWWRRDDGSRIDLAVSGGGGGAGQLLSKTVNVNLAATGTTNLYTVPAGETAHVTRVELRVVTATGVTVFPIAGLGVAAGEADIVAPITWQGLATGKVYGRDADALKVFAAAASIIKLGVDTAATATALTVDVYLFGFLESGAAGPAVGIGGAGSVTVLNSQPGAVGSVGNAGTTLKTYTIPANTMSVNDTIRITAWGTHSGGGQDGETFLWWGGTGGTILLPSHTVNHATVAQGWRAVAEITASGAATQESVGIIGSGEFTANATTPLRRGHTLALNASIEILLQGQNTSGTLDDQSICHGFIVEILKAP